MMNDDGKSADEKTARPLLTPRQAAAFRIEIDTFVDLYLTPWLDGEHPRPLHTLGVFGDLDLRVMIHVGENRAWVALARERCVAVSAEIHDGVTPFDREGCFFDEVLMALMLHCVSETFSDNASNGAFDGIEPHVDDDDWCTLSDCFDDAALWGEWEIPTLSGSRLVPAVLSQLHPFTWFDTAPPRFLS